MKWFLIIILAMFIAVLGCTPNQKSKEEAPTEQATQEISFDDAMSTYKTGEWLTDYDQALTVATKMNRPVLINFTGSDWCGWCIKLSKEVFSQDAFNKYASDNLVLLKLDFPRNIKQSAELKEANEAKAKEFKVEGFPTIVLVNAKGIEINRTGYQPGGAEAYVKHLQELLTQSK